MTSKTTAKYGTWESPIQPKDFAATGAVTLDQVRVNRKNGKTYLVEIRPDEGGRGVIVEFEGTQARDISPKEHNALSRVHEYGGASIAVSEANGHIIYTDLGSRLVYDLDPQSGNAVSVVKEDPEVYFADFDVHPSNPELILAIREDHHAGTIVGVVNTLVLINASTKQVDVLAEGCDFYAWPRFSPDGRYASWVQWDHPNMPWDFTELWIAEISGPGELDAPRCIAGQEHKASVVDPCWSSGSTLFFLDDKSEYWQLFCYNTQQKDVTPVKLAGLESHEFAMPAWFLGTHTYSPLTHEKLIMFYNKDARQTAILVDVPTSSFNELKLDISVIGGNSIQAIDTQNFVVVGSNSATAPKLLHVDISDSKEPRISTLRDSTKQEFDESYLSPAQQVTFPRTHGREDPIVKESHALFFPPQNPRYQAPADNLPPLIVLTHGGPTSQTLSGFSLQVQYWTSRGYALVHINYVGSTGYGRSYRNALKGNFGQYEVADAASCVSYLASQKMIDEKRVSIRGHSAGGYNCMQALALYPDIWACGIAGAGMSDIQIFLDETHKFESRYIDQLLSPRWSELSEKEKDEIIKDRSPISRVDKIKAPMMIVTGDEDTIVPPNQSEGLARALKERGVPCELVVWEGEGHMFKKGTTLQGNQEKWEEWYRKYLLK